MQYYLFFQNKLLLTNGEEQVPHNIEIGNECLPFCLSDGVECMVAAVDAVPDGYKEFDLRASYDVLSLTDYQRAGKAAELLFWHANHKYCGKCGAKMYQTSAISLKCSNCETEIWPQLSPAVIVLIHKDNEILLVRSRSFRGSYYGLVAGFVELGESFEEALIREVREETNLQIENIKYFASQPWPYPQGIMIGFTAKYAGGELKLQDEELACGGWFDINNLPQIPKPLSLARKLIDNYIETHNTKK